MWEGVRTSLSLREEGGWDAIVLLSTGTFEGFECGSAWLIKPYLFFFTSRRRLTRFDWDWSPDVCSSDRAATIGAAALAALLGGCETLTMSLGKKIDYKSSSSAPALEIPPDLTAPAYDDRYQASTASAADRKSVV